MLSWTGLSLIFLAGFVSSFINIMAGGGSALTLGVMMLLGVDASSANGANRVGLLVQNLVGVAAYQKEERAHFKESLTLCLWTIPGAVIGAVSAIKISNVVFEKILACVMILIILTLFFPKAQGAASVENNKATRRLLYPTLFLIGFYGGFIQAGVGILIMAAFRHLRSMELVKVNFYKIVIILGYTIPVLLLFGLTKHIHWMSAGTLAVGSSLGAWASVKISLKKGEKAIQMILGVAILLMALKFLFNF
jgi:uncharacterized protein